MNKVVLFPNLAQFNSMSMRRYARELSEALHIEVAGRWIVDDFHCEHIKCLAELGTGWSLKLAERLGRLVKYPLSAAVVKADVYHILDQSHANVGIFLNARKTVITCHDIIPLLAQKGVLPIQVTPISEFTYPLRVKLIKRFAAIISDSESTKRDLVKHAEVPEERITVVHPGLNKQFKPIASAEMRLSIRRKLASQYDIPVDGKIILHVGSNTRYKNSPSLIRALKQLNETCEFNVGAWLLRLGSDFFEDEKALIKNTGVSDRIIYIGSAIDDQTLASFYQAADVLAFPSLWEGFGWPPLESMACGTPVVTSNAASLPEIVGDAGIMLRSDDEAALVNALNQVLSNENLRQGMIERGIARAGSFTWERAAGRVLAVYERILSSRA